MLSRKEIDKKIMEYLIKKKPQLGRFYLLPKIHKRTFNVPGRPVISNNGTATENISAFLDFYLKPIVQTIPHILEDTSDFLCRLNDLPEIPENAILVTFDTVGLYPNIPHEEGIEIMKTFLNERDNKPVRTESLCDLAKLILKENYFELRDEVFRQILGTAIGTKFAPTCANIFMAGLERKIFESGEFNPFVWLRFLDDIFCLWTEGEENLNNFFKYLNEFHPTIKFTMEKSYEKINFLDAVVYKENKHLSTDLYTKDTDTHQYLHAKSCHRSCIKRAIPYGQAIRIKRICSDENNLNRRLLELESWLSKRGYSSKNVRTEIERVHSVSRDDLLKKVERENDFCEPVLVLTYHPALNRIHEILRNAQRHVYKSARLAKVLKSPPRVAFRNAKTLKDRLVRSKLRNESEVETGSFKCNGKRCEVCNYIEPGSKFKSFVTQKSYEINFRFDCNSSDVIYLISCKICGRQYTGTTVTRFRERFNQYKSNVNLYSQGVRGMMQEKTISHFFTENHNGCSKDMSVQIIDHCDPNDKERRESYWIETLETSYPKGLNYK